jgi:DNA (cytosine-5)-methyltransferase 1
LKYLSVCSGIEAASVAWHPLGWEPLAFSEIEAFPRAVLEHHYPGVPLHGDFTKLRDEPWIVDADILVGGTPCQAFSVAGLRKSLGDDRGNLSLEFIKLADSIDAAREAQGRDPGIVVWENVPGVLSVKDNAFGCFLAGLAGDVDPFVPPRGKWTNAGVALGPARTVAWRILDAQYFGLAQQRRRVFVVASAREGFDPAAVLLEFEGVRRDSPPRRETGKDAAAGARFGASVSSGSGWWSESGGLGATLRAQDSVTKADTLVHGRSGERSHWGGMENPHSTLNQSFNTGAIGYSNQELFSQRGAGLVGEASTGDISHCLNAGGMGRQDYETETLVTHALRAEGFDASEDGTGRGTPLVPVQAFYSTESRCDHFPPPDLSPPLKVGSNGGGQPPTIAFSAKDHGADASEELSPTLRAMPHDASHANGGGQMAVAFAHNIRDADARHEVAYPLDLRNAGRDPDKWDSTNRQGLGLGEDGDPSPTISTAFVPGVAAYAFQPRIARNGRGDMGDVVNALNAQSGETGKGDAAPCVATVYSIMPQNSGRDYKARPVEVAQPIMAGGPVGGNQGGDYVQQHMAVRRLTPVECERLQGFPDNYTAIPWKKKPADQCPDGPRYKALGNSMAVPCMRWIGRRIAEALR